MSDRACTEPDAAIKVFWPDPAAAPFAGPCPNCDALDAKPRVLDVAWVAPKLPKGDRKGVFACPACAALFYPPLKVPNYHDPDVMDWGWHQFHIQQGAGLLPITDKISRLNRLAGSRCLEIGCGYGFGLDFAIHALGWQASGIDPSPMAQLGRRDLGITIIDGYFPQADPATQAWDVIVATEVIEHVQRPIDLLRALRDRLAPDGILLLTTPDGAAIHPNTPEPALVQLLAPGIHMVFQTEASLRRLFSQTGFGAVQITSDGQTLTAYAGTSAAQLGGVTDDPAARRARFRRYLAARAQAIPPTTDLGLGFNGRDFFEATIDQDFTEAAAIRSRLWPAINAKFGLDLDALLKFPSHFSTLPLNQLKDAMPLNLGMILYAEASRLRADPATRARSGLVFHRARAAALLLADALARLSLNDGLAEDIAWRGGAEAAIEMARDSNVRALGVCAELAPHPERGRILWRVMIELMNSDAAGAARALQRQEQLYDPDRDDLDPITRHDGWVVLGQLALAPEGDPALALDIAARLNPADPMVADFRLSAFIRLVNAARFPAASALVPMIEPLVATRLDTLGDDAALSLAMLDLTSAQPERAAGRLAGRAIDTALITKILLEALVRLVNDARFDQAAALVARHDLLIAIRDRHDALGADARLALGRLYLSQIATLRGEFSPQIAGLDLSAADRAALQRDGFVRLVNDGDYQAARLLDQADPIAALSTDQADPTHADARAALALLAIAIGDPAAAPDLIADYALAPARRRGILLAAFSALVNQAHYQAAMALDQSVNIATLSDAEPGQAGDDATLGLAQLDLARHAPKAALARIAARSINPAARAGLIAACLVALVNQGDYRAAQNLAKAEPIAGWAEGSNPAHIDAAHLDAAMALVTLELANGDPASVPGLLDHYPALPASFRARMQADAFLRIHNQGDFATARRLAAACGLRDAQDDLPAAMACDVACALLRLDLAETPIIADLPSRLQALMALGGTQEQIRDLAIQGFSAAVAANDLAQAGSLRPFVGSEPDAFFAATTPAAQSLCFAWGLYFMQSDLPMRAEIAFAAVRRGIVATITPGTAVPGLFWEALRGELIMLNRTERQAEATALGQAMTLRYAGAPADFYPEPAPAS